MSVDVPGVPAEDVKIEVHNNVLSVSGERKHEKKEETEGFTRFERSFGSFKRQMRLPKVLYCKSMLFVAVH